jgi:LacI family transcriptional regulator
MVERYGGVVAEQGSRRQATIEDVAREAGVSRAAVSKVLRSAYGVSPAMKERVAAAIEHLDYRPRVAARAMRGASFTIGFEIPDFTNPFFTKVLGAATEALRNTNYQLIIAPAEGGLREGYKALEALVDRQVDGVVAISPLVSQSWLERLATHTPVVMLGRHDHSDRYDTMAGDDAAGATSVMHHLLGLGHTRIMHLTRGEDRTIRGSGTPHTLRLEAYLDCMNAAGLADQIDVVRCERGDDEASRVIAAALAERSPTAIFAAHDEIALAALRGVAESGRDVSVAGYDNVTLAGQPGISLTTVDQGGERMGTRVIEMLLERIAGRTESVHEISAPTLVKRDSTRPPAVERRGRPRLASAGAPWRR